jgi:queuine tRNA-ribosyltransferase
MGVGEPRDILGAVARGVDMFDCVLPTRNGRNAFAYTWNGPLRLRNAAHARDRRPLDEGCPCLACRHYSRGTIRHLFMADEMLGPILLSIHNLTFFARFMAAIREAISQGQFQEKSREWIERICPSARE